MCEHKHFPNKKTCHLAGPGVKVDEEVRFYRNTEKTGSDKISPFFFLFIENQYEFVT